MCYFNKQGRRNLQWLVSISSAYCRAKENIESEELTYIYEKILANFSLNKKLVFRIDAGLKQQKEKSNSNG